MDPADIRIVDQRELHQEELFIPVIHLNHITRRIQIRFGILDPHAKFVVRQNHLADLNLTGIRQVNTGCVIVVEAITFCTGDCAAIAGYCRIGCRANDE